MSPVSRISKWGNSLAIRIPVTIARQWGVREGSAIELLPCGDHLILRKVTFDLEEMLAQMSVDNLHSETDFGPAQGKELW